MRLVTLTTDFGTRDTYVAELKGVLHRRGPSALQVIDLSHEIEPQNVREAALFAAGALPSFPTGTIHLVVVDPGVGTARRALALDWRGQHLVGPDNGVFSLLYDGEQRAVELHPERLGLAAPAPTFHGRDLFAPAAAALAGGSTLSSLGEPIEIADLVRLQLHAPSREGDALFGEVIHVDRFGNLITNLRSKELLELGPGWPTLRVCVEDLTLKIATHYAEVPEGSPLALLGSSDRLEIAARNASAARITGAGVGTPVVLRRV